MLVQKRPQLAQRTSEEEYKHQHNQHNKLIEKMTKRVEKSKTFIIVTTIFKFITMATEEKYV
jgi:hypothetical protein